jgi:hypothetical protein
MEHLITDPELRRFAQGASPPGEKRAILLHLLRGCPSCSERLTTLALPKSIPVGAYDDVFRRVERFLPDDADPEDPLGLSLPRASLRA